MKTICHNTNLVWYWVIFVFARFCCKSHVLHFSKPWRCLGNHAFFSEPWRCLGNHACTRAHIHAHTKLNTITTCNWCTSDQQVRPSDGIQVWGETAHHTLENAYFSCCFVYKAVRELVCQSRLLHMPVKKQHLWRYSGEARQLIMHWFNFFCTQGW